jgi:TetR/AcrR family transcriptional regulator, cholesterol catabolism regulator
MARIAERRAAAEPTTDEQAARRSAILRAATQLGKTRPVERISSQEIAASAGVALRTLYRYYPSKYHVFAAVLTDQVAHLRAPALQTDDPPEAVADFLVLACGKVLRNKHLAHAMITSTQAVRAQSEATRYRTMLDLILSVAGVEDPTPAQVQIVRLVEQTTFGVLTWTVGGEVTPAQALIDIRFACGRLIGNAFSSDTDRAATDP